MRTIILGLAGLLGLTSAAMADDPGCASFKWPVSREQALLPAAPAAQSGTDIAVGAAADLTLVPADTVHFAIAPERAPAAGTFGATANVMVPPQGEIQVTLSDEAWIDVVQNGQAAHSLDFSGVKTCPGIRKSVRFKLMGGAAIIQLSGAKKADLKMAVVAPE